MAKNPTITAANEREYEDEYNPNGMLQTMPTALLAKIANGEIDAREAARFEMACRGLGKNMAWIGFDEAFKLWAKNAAELKRWNETIAEQEKMAAEYKASLR